MDMLTSKTPFAYCHPRPPHNYSTFYFDDHPIAKGQFSISTISNSTVHPWIPQDDFSYDCFNIKAHKCGDLMGGFNHIQE